MEKAKNVYGTNWEDYRRVGEHERKAIGSAAPSRFSLFDFSRSVAVPHLVSIVVTCAVVARKFGERPVT
jgi:hypothetical protein